MSSGRGYAAVSFGQIHYRYAGGGDKPVLVLLHQTPSTSEMYAELMQELSGDFRLLAPDTPGSGLSDALPGDLSVASLADAFAEFLDEIGVNRCYVFGHHTGAAIAAELSARFPKLVAAVALSGPTLLDDELRARVRSMATAIPVAVDGLHFEMMWDRIAAKDSEAPLPIIVRETINGVRLGDRYLEMYEAVIDHDFEQAAKTTACPALVFAGTKDPLFGKLDDVCNMLPQGSRATIEGARTFVCETHKVEVAGLLRDFFPEEAA